MELYLAKGEKKEKTVALDDLFLTKSLPTTAGSKMLDGYMSLFDAEVFTLLSNSGFALGGKAKVGEFAIDLLGETCYKGATEKDGKLVYAPCELVKDGEVLAALCLDANGAPRRGAAQSGLVYLKPTYGTVSRFGLVGVASSGDTVGICAETTDTVREILSVIAHHDDKDGTSLSEDACISINKEKKAAKVAVLKDFIAEAEADVQKSIYLTIEALKKSGVEVVEINSDEIAAARVAWNILMSAETCNNVSRFDGVKYGYRTQNFTNLDELYTNSRTEAFGDLIKTCILFGSETLSDKNYMKQYDKSLRIRRVISEKFALLFKSYDAVLLPATSKTSYSVEDVKENLTLCYEENKFTAPASITGLPALVAGGVQFIADAFEEGKLLCLAQIIEQEG
ncbi:MAG: hypothetical protein E7580_04085 [Ruminococcaceae bacterium]|nr:hypothetical protein [Oscillospiraceae bacterium]